MYVKIMLLLCLLSTPLHAMQGEPNKSAPDDLVTVVLKNSTPDTLARSVLAHGKNFPHVGTLLSTDEQEIALTTITPEGWGSIRTILEILQKIEDIGQRVKPYPTPSAFAQILSTNIGHTDTINQLVFNPQGTRLTRLASCSNDGTIKIWDPRTLSLISILETPARSIAWHPTDPFILASARGTRVELWNPYTRECTAKIEFEGEEKIKSIAYSPDGEFIAAGSSKGTITIWSMADKGSLRSFEGHAESKITSITWLDNKTFISGSQDNTIKLWNSENFECITTLAGHESGIITIALNPDRTMLASAGENGTVFLWDLTPPYGHRSAGFSDGDGCLAWHPFGTILAIKNSENFGFLDIATNQWLKADDMRALELDISRAYSARACAWSPDGTIVTAGTDEGVIYRWRSPLDSMGALAEALPDPA